MTDQFGLVLFGDVVESHLDSIGSTAWLRDLVAELDAAYGDQRLAPFGFARGDELQGLLAPTADPFTAILRSALAPGGRRMRWVVVRGEVDADATGGRAPATERTGPAFVKARVAIEAARTSHERLVILTGEASVDLLLSNLVPAFVDMLDDLTERQRTVARLALIDDLRQSEVADRLKIRRATVSVAFSRARVRSLQRLVAGLRLVYAGNGSDALLRAAAPEPAPEPAPPAVLTE
jgi:DNA-binding CsgD family transcriptional regulator